MPGSASLCQSLHLSAVTSSQRGMEQVKVPGGTVSGGSG